MITQDLIEYIKLQTEKNVSKNLITTDLLNVGWHIEDIEEGFNELEKTKSPLLSIPTESVNQNTTISENIAVSESPLEQKLNPTQKFDPYREIPDVDDVSLERIRSEYNATVNKNSQESVKIWTPIVLRPKVEETPVVPEVKPVVEEIKKPTEEVQFSKRTDIEPYMVEVSAGEKEEPKVAKPFLSDSIANIGQNNSFPPADFSNVNSSIKTEANQFGSQPIVSTSPKEESSIQQPIQPTEQVKPIININSMSDIVPRNAMISSYSQDILSAQKEEPKEVDKKKLYIKWGIIAGSIIIVVALVFAFMGGVLKIPFLNLSFSAIKKDPRTVLINTPASVMSLSSYKADTDVVVSSPSIASITTGLASGVAVNTKDRDTISISTKGSANRVNNQLSFDYLATLKSSLLKEDMVSDWKYDGNNLFVSVPDLSQILGENAPKATTVSLTPNQLGSIVGEFSTQVQNIIKKIDIYNILSEDVPLYVKTETGSIFKEFINSLSYVEKGTETINGVETYHYEMTADRASTKKFLSSLSDLFIAKLPQDQQSELDGAIGSSTISAFDVWIGANDDHLYKIKFTLSVPLSSVVGLNDSGIAGNEVKLDWTTSYYDLDVENNIKIPQAEKNMEDFIKSIRDIKIKNIIYSFRPQATSFRNAIGSYGVRSNPTGNCTNPNPGSLFSPKGHNKVADTAIGGISNSMNSLLSVTNGVSSCYSTSAQWALSAPLFSSSTESPINFYCADSSGSITTLPSQIKGPVCK